MPAQLPIDAHARTYWLRRAKPGTIGVARRLREKFEIADAPRTRCKSKNVREPTATHAARALCDRVRQVWGRRLRLGFGLRIEKDAIVVCSTGYLVRLRPRTRALKNILILLWMRFMSEV